MSTTLPPDDSELSTAQLQEAIKALETLPIPKELQPIVRVAIRDLKLLLVAVPGLKSLAPIARLRAFLRERTP